MQGCYPESLLSEWDAFDEDRGSDSVRPGKSASSSNQSDRMDLADSAALLSDKLPSDQMYAIILLANGGTDLESFRFSSTVGWNQALSIIVQLAETLNVAEASGRFEVSYHAPIQCFHLLSLIFLDSIAIFTKAKSSFERPDLMSLPPSSTLGSLASIILSIKSKSTFLPFLMMSLKARESSGMCIEQSGIW